MCSEIGLTLNQNVNLSAIAAMFYTLIDQLAVLFPTVVGEVSGY